MQNSRAVEPIILDACDSDEFVPPEVACFGKRYVKKWLNSVVNAETLRYWRQLFYTAAISRFVWSGLPDGVDARYLETLLFSGGNVVMTKLEGLDRFVIGRPSQQGLLDTNNNPNSVRIICSNGLNLDRHLNYWPSENGVVMPPDAVQCWDNNQRMPLASVVDVDCRRLATMDSVFMQHVNALRVPYVINVPEEGKKNAKMFFDRIMSGSPALFETDTARSIVGVSVQQTMPASGYAGDKLLNDELKIVSRVYTLLGIDSNAAAEKRERVQTAETLANNEQFLVQRNAAQATRKLFCEQANELFGLDVECVWAVRHVGETADAGQTIEDGADYGTGGGD